MKDISIIIPVYNESSNITLLYSRLKNVVSQITTHYELVFVNDGSRDNSMAMIKKLSSEDPSVKYIDFSRNFGHQVAVSAGIDLAAGNAMVIIDADLQDPPELILEMYKKYKEGNEVVFAKRKTRKGESVFKLLTAKIFYRILSSITAIDIPLDTGDFRIIDKKIAEVLKQMPEQEKFLRGQIAWAGFNQTFVEYERNERHAGKTGYPFKKMLRFALDGITSFSNFPLKFATLAGFAVSFVAFILMLYALYSRFILKDFVQGWTSLILSVLFIGGIQLICLGIIGEYISRMSNNIRNRPMYIVKETNI